MSNVSINSERNLVTSRKKIGSAYELELEIYRKSRDQIDYINQISYLLRKLSSSCANFLITINSEVAIYFR